MKRVRVQKLFISIIEGRGCHGSLLLACLILILSPTPAWAQCATPAASEGALEYFDADSAYKICAGTAWETIQFDSALTACATARQREYDATEKAYKICDGANWQKVACGCTNWASPSETNKITETDNTEYGSSIDVSGTYMIVGALTADPGGITNAGVAYLYDVSDPASPVLKSTLTASDKALGDEFGNAVAIDGTSVAVAAQRDDPGGSVYLFDVSDPVNPVQEFKLTASSSNDWFGESIDINNNLLLIGAWGADPAGVNAAGEAYLYDITNLASPVLRSTLTASDKATNDFFGREVAIDGNFALVTAINGTAASGGVDNGSVYLFDITTPASPNQVAEIGASVITDDFGYSTALSADDSVVIVGAPEEASRAGAVYIFDISTPSSPSQSARFVASDSASKLQFGYDMSLNGSTVLIGARYEDDYGGDGCSDAPIPPECSSGAWAGRGYFYDISVPGSPNEIAIIQASDKQTGDEFGSAVGLSDSFAAVGALSRSESPAVEAVYIFEGSCCSFGACTQAGQLDYDSGTSAYRWCDGTDWRQIDTAP